MRKTFLARRKGAPAEPALLYYDARCSLCVSLVRWVRRLDLFRTLELRSTLDTPALQAGLDQTQLDRAAWLVTSAGVAYPGFHAFRKLALRLPPLWPVAPLLWMPGMAFWGVRLYRWVADHRVSIFGCHPSESGMKSISPPPYGRGMPRPYPSPGGEKGPLPPRGVNDEMTQLFKERRT